MSERVARLPSWLAPRPESSTSPRLWRLETLVLVIAGLFLAVTSINDLVLTVHQDSRLAADQRTWRAYTHRDYYNVSAAALVLGQPIDLSCANATPGPPGEERQLCILIRGPILENGLRAVIGGFQLPAQAGDFPANRSDCYGAAEAQHLCLRR